MRLTRHYRQHTLINASQSSQQTQVCARSVLSCTSPQDSFGMVSSAAARAFKRREVYSSCYHTWTLDLYSAQVHSSPINAGSQHSYWQKTVNKRMLLRKWILINIYNLMLHFYKTYRCRIRSAMTESCPLPPHALWHSPPVQQYPRPVYAGPRYLTIGRPASPVAAAFSLT